MAGQSKQARYKDLDLDFVAHPVTGDVVQLKNKDAVKQSLRNLIMMGKFDKPFQPNINSKIRKLLFEPDSPLTRVEIRKSIYDVVRRYEPRIQLLDIRVLQNVRKNAYDLTIEYQIVNQPSVETVSILLERLR
tara:strand:+ start:259 stop:657 length:399 start_codon:yes stop_codon:yes gene_type:complete